MILGKYTLNEILEVQMIGNKHQGFGYVQHEPKIKPIVAQSTSTIKKVTKMIKMKVSLPTPLKGTTDMYGYTILIIFTYIILEISLYLYVTAMGD